MSTVFHFEVGTLHIHIVYQVGPVCHAVGKFLSFLWQHKLDKNVKDLFAFFSANWSYMKTCYTCPLFRNGKIYYNGLLLLEDIFCADLTPLSSQSENLT